MQSHTTLLELCGGDAQKAALVQDMILTCGWAYIEWVAESGFLSFLAAHPDASPAEGARWMDEHMPADVRAAWREHRRAYLA